MADICFTSIIRTYQRRLNSKPYVCSTAFGRATLDANGVPNKLFFAFLFNDPDVGVHCLKDVGLIRSSMVCCKCGPPSHLGHVAVALIHSSCQTQSYMICAHATRPMMDYACPALRSTARSHVRRLQVLQSKCLRLATDVPWYST